MKRYPEYKERCGQKKRSIAILNQVAALNKDAEF